MTRILFFLILIGIAAWYYRRWTTPRPTTRRPAQDPHSTDPYRTRREAVTTLVKDPKTGEYRVEKED